MIYIDFILAGLATGSIYALVAVGLTLIYGVSRVVNVAHGDFLAVGAFCLVVWSTAGLNDGPLGAVPALVVAALLGAALGALVEKLLVRPVLASRVEAERRVLVLTLGLSIVMSASLLLIFGPRFYQAPFLVTGVVQIGGLQVSSQRLAIFILGGAVIVGLAAFLKYTRYGIAIRAVADSVDSAMAAGIRIRRVYMATFALGTCLAAIAGVLIAPVASAFPSMGFAFTIKAFVVVIVGGLGSIPGALIASYALGVVESLSILVLPTGYASVIGPLAMLVALLVRPWGLLGAKETRF